MNWKLSIVSLAALLLLGFQVVAQEEEKPTEEQLESYRLNQYEIDRNHSGIGFSAYRPGFGSGVQVNRPWFGVNILSDFLEIKFGAGQVENIRRIDLEPSEPFNVPGDQKIDFGYMLSIGGNIPIKALEFGSYKSYNEVFRGHPIVGISLGLYGIKDSINYAQRGYDNIWFLGLTPGYRIRLPYVSIDFNIEMTAGVRLGDTDEYYKSVGLYPSITLRADALKQLLNPQMVSASYSQTTVSNIQSKTTKSTVNGNGYRIERYETTTTADVSVTSGSVGVQDIGTVFGVGAKYLWTPIARRPYMNPGRMFGVNAYGRSGLLDFGVNLEGGRIGHGSKLIAKGVGEYRRKVERKETFGVGDISMASAYVNVGLDISPLFLIPLGITMDKGNATSFLSASAGMIFGGHFAFGQEFSDPDVAVAMYNQELLENPDVKTKFIDPSSFENTGFLTGFYFGIHVGALSFTVQNNRYFGAPFASGTMYSFAYRYPISF